MSEDFERAARLDASEAGWAKNTAAAMRSAVRAHILPAIGGLAEGKAAVAGDCPGRTR